MKDNNVAIAIFCHRTMNCSDHPIIVIVGKDGSTYDVIDEPNINTVEDLNAYDNYKYNGILTYTITVSLEEYHNRFEHLASWIMAEGDEM